MEPDCRDWMDEVEKLGGLEHIRGASPRFEIGAISSLNYRRPDPAALCFDEIPGHPAGYRVLTGSLSNAARMGLTLGLGEDHDDRSLMEVLPGKTRGWMARAPEFAAREVADAPVLAHQVSSAAIDLSIFPSPTWHEGDGGPYIGTGDLCITTNPETGLANGGCCRAQVHADGRAATVQMSPFNDTAINVERWFAREGRAPMVISMGHHPLYLLVGGSNIPPDVSEFDYAGAVRGEPVEFVRGPATGLPIPVSSEIALEGWLVPGDTLTEGPFGESKGYYSRVKEVQAMEMVNLFYRDDPILLGSPPGRPPYDFSYMWSVMKSALVFESLVRAGVPGVRDVWVHEAGRTFIVVSIEQQYAGHSRQAAVIASSCREGGYASRYVVVVDEDVDPRKLDEVTWAMCTRSNPEIDIEIQRKTWGSPEDPMRADPSAAYASRGLIDACKPYGKIDSFPKVADYSRDLLDEVRRRWPEATGGRRG